MRAVAEAVVFFACVVLGAVATEDVTVLTQDTFDAFVEGNDISLVKFYAPWCGHCKHLAPEFAKAATTLLSNDPPVKLAEVDATVETELGERFQINGYPTLKIFRRGVSEPAEYNGPRDAAGIVRYMRAQAGPAVTLLDDSAAAVDAFAAVDNGVALVCYAAEGSAPAKAFTALAESLREEFRFAHVRTAADAPAKVVACRHFDHEPAEVVLEDTAKLASTDALRAWLKAVALPLAGVFNQNTAKRYLEAGLPRLTVFASVDEVHDPAGTRYVLNRMRRAAKDFEGKLLFVAMDRAAREAQELNFDADAKVGMAVLSNTGKYRAEGISAVNVDSLKAFAQDFLDGKIEKYVKSEAEPANNDGPVRILTGKSFQTEVVDATHDTFLVAHAPWCGHCKALLPKWEKLGEKLAQHKDKVVIAKIDATANDLPPQFSLRGYPSIFFIKAGQADKPLQYEGSREVGDLEAYVRKMTSFSDLKKEL